MAILVDEKTKVLIQGITGNQGAFHTSQMIAYGTRVVAGVSPGKSGQEVHGVPVYETVEEAVQSHGANTSILFVPAPFAKDAAMEAMAAGIRVVIVLTEHIPLHDELELVACARQRGATMVGPNTFGVISPGKCKAGFMPSVIYKPGPVGIAARSGTLSYEVAAALSAAGLGQSTAVGLGGDRIVGMSFVDALGLFAADAHTKAVVLVGEIGGTAEEEAAEFLKTMDKPAVAYLAGKSAPPGKRMGHAGAIIEKGRGTFESKVKAFKAAGCAVAEFPWDVPNLVSEALKGR